MKRAATFFSCFILSLRLFGQNPMIDSLLHRVEFLSKQTETFSSDTDQVNTHILLCLQFKNMGEYDKAKEHANHAWSLANKVDYKKGIAEAYLRTGNVVDLQGDHLKALENYFKAQKLYEEIGYKTGIGKAFANIGIVYQLLGDYPKALEYHLKGLKIGEELNFKLLIANTCGNIGITYYNQKDFENSLKYNFKALHMAEEMGDKIGIARNITNIGIVYSDQKNYSQALEYDFKALKMAEESGYKQAIATLLGNIGTVYDSQGDFPKALDHHSKELKIMQEMGDKTGTALALGNIGALYLKHHDLKIAEEYLQKALSLSIDIHDLAGQQQWHQGLSDLYKIENEWKKSMEHYRQSVLARDSLFNEGNTKKTVQAQMNYEFDKKQAAEKLEQEKRDAIAKEEKRRQQLFLWLVGAVAAAIAAIALIIFRSWRITRKQKLVIEDQKLIVEQKNKHITDSINYAKRIQDAILPSVEDMKKCFPENFVLFQPREIVSGDFYWLSRQNNKTVLAVADCTGHGVPGAFMSMIGNTLLNEIVNEQKIVQPAEILNHLHEGIVHALHQESRSQDDGMDITLCLFDHHTNKLSFAGANHSLFVAHEGILSILEGDYFSIGSVFGKKKDSFTQKEITLQKNTTLFLSSDGYADQPGGDKGKKFMTKRFQELLSSVSSHTATEQGQILRKTFEDWKGKKQQVDDVLLIGIKI